MPYASLVGTSEAMRIGAVATIASEVLREVMRRVSGRVRAVGEVWVVLSRAKSERSLVLETESRLDERGLGRLGGSGRGGVA